MFSYANQLIGLVGRAEVGKDTAAAILTEVLDLRRYTFAQPVTIKCATLLNMAHADFLAIPKNSLVINNLTKRELMQHVGKQLRERNEYFAIQDLQYRIDSNEPDNYLFNGQLITDVRLPLEAGYIRSKGGILIHIKNPNAKLAPSDVTEQDLHTPNHEKILINNTTLENFKKDVHEYAAELHKQLVNQAA